MTGSNKNLDLSLADLVKSSKSQRPRGRGRGAGRPAEARGRGANANGGGRMRSSPRTPRAAPYPMMQPVVFQAPAPPVSTATKLLVTNLHPKVDKSDIRELFGEVGRLLKADVHYDSNGRSLGTADVVYERPGDARKAFDKYNGLSLDRKPLQMTVVDDKPRSSVTSRVTSSGHRQMYGIPQGPIYAGRGGGYGTPRGGLGGRGGARGGGRGAGRGARRGGRPRPKTEEELNAELEGFMKEE